LQKNKRVIYLEDSTVFRIEDSGHSPIKEKPKITANNLIFYLAKPKRKFG